MKRFLAVAFVMLSAAPIVAAGRTRSAAQPLGGRGRQTQETSQVPRFSASVDRVTLATSVRTKQGKPLTNLKQEDFELYDDGQLRPITDFRVDPTPVSIGFLVDFSGSMDVAARRQAARDNLYQLISWLEPNVDEAGLYVFDKQLRELQPLAPAPGNILAQLDTARRPFGVTSLFDAIAETGRILAATGGTRRAVVALTDGEDNASTMSATEVSTIASSIDVPVYVVVVVSPLDRFGHGTVDEEGLARQMEGPLSNLAHWTGGEIYAGVGPSQSNQAARELVTDLRQQYLIAFEPSTRPGWHPLQLRIRDRDKEKNLVVRTRGGYTVRAQSEL